MLPAVTATGAENVPTCQPEFVSPVTVALAINCPVGLHNETVWVPEFCGPL